MPPLLKGGKKGRNGREVLVRWPCCVPGVKEEKKSEKDRQQLVNTARSRGGGGGESGETIPCSAAFNSAGQGGKEKREK